MLTFDRTENVQKIYEITDIRGMRVEVTPYRKTGLLPQCKNCQSWGHTKSYCHKEPRCVKCAGKHTTESCNKSKDIPPKCYNCGENHPANYRGCVVAKELQALRNKAANPKKLLPPPDKQVITTRNEQLPIPHTAGEIRSYADAAKAQPPSSQQQPTPATQVTRARPPLSNTDQAIHQQLQLILAKLDQQAQVHATLSNRLERLENATPRRGP